MRTLLVATLVTLLAIPAYAAEEPKTEDQKTMYAVGLAIARELNIFSLTPAELDLVKQGITDAVTGKKTVVELEAYNKKVQELAAERGKAKAEKLAEAAKGVVEQTGKEKGAVTSPSGLIYVPLAEGTGASPTATDTVKVNYRGTLVDGKEFDSSYKRGQPAEFPLNGVIKCWTEGVQKMKVGGKAKLLCPPAIAYGPNGAGGVIPGNATLIFEVELLEVKKK